MAIKVIATGDSLFTADFPAEYEKIRKTLDDFIIECDVKITNLETNLSDFGNFPNQYSGGTWINTRKELFKYLESYGFNFYGTANNHCMDYSYAGLLSTIDVLNKNGYAHAGTGKSLEDAEKPAILKLKNGETAAYIYFKSALNLAKFSKYKSDLKANSEIVKDCLYSELEITKELYGLICKDAKIGFEMTNHYYYNENLLFEKFFV